MGNKSTLPSFPEPDVISYPNPLQEIHLLFTSAIRFLVSISPTFWRSPNCAFVLKSSMVQRFRNHTNDKDMIYIEKIAKEFEENQKIKKVLDKSNIDKIEV